MLYYDISSISVFVVAFVGTFLLFIAFYFGIDEDQIPTDTQVSERGVSGYSFSSVLSMTRRLDSQFVKGRLSKTITSAVIHPVVQGIATILNAVELCKSFLRLSISLNSRDTNSIKAPSPLMHRKIKTKKTFYSSITGFYKRLNDATEDEILRAIAKIYNEPHLVVEIT